MKTLFNFGRSEYVLVENFSELSYEIGNYGNDVLWICDTNTARMVRPLPQPNVIINPGEESKNLNTLERILAEAVDAGLTRSGTFLALGGGVVCDVTLLAASLFHRGCRCLLIPTTLMAMGDACLGGKNGINFRGVKNCVGNRYEPDKVIICPDMIRSLPEREYYSGLSEIIKHALVSDNKEMYQTLVLERKKILVRDLFTISPLITMSLEVKKEILEHGDPNVLTLGHVFANVLEAMFDYKKTHGECVAWGISKSTELGVECGLCDRSFSENLNRLYRPFRYNIDYKIPRGNWQLFKTLLAKNSSYRNSGNRILILTDTGTVVSHEADEESIKEVVLEKAVYR